MTEAIEQTQEFADINRETRLSSTLTILFSQAVAEQVGAHSTDIETMDLLNIYGPMTAGQLAERAGLTSGATSRLIDRLERAGYVRRHQDASDRRRVIVEPDWERAQDIVQHFEQLGRRIRELWSTLTNEELAFLTEYLRHLNQILAEEHTVLRGQPLAPSTGELPAN